MISPFGLRDNACGNQAFEEVAADLPHFIDNVYNTTRLHSALGYLSPVQAEERNVPAWSNQAA